MLLSALLSILISVPLEMMVWSYCYGRAGGYHRFQYSPLRGD